MISEKENIANVFYAFHDGDIIFEKEENSTQIWKIECEYLAEMINPKFKLFWIKIYNCNYLQFEAWMNPIELPNEIWTSTKEIFKTELEILSAKVNDFKIEISCNQLNTDLNFSGGQLFFGCEGIEIFDQEWNMIKEDELKQLVNEYWDKTDGANKILT